MQPSTEKSIINGPPPVGFIYKIPLPQIVQRKLSSWNGSKGLLPQDYMNHKRFNK